MTEPTVNPSASVGWDIGGAHLKAALLNDDDQIAAVLQQPCPLWLGIEQLHQAVTNILAALPSGIRRHAITMTGELVDCFESRQQGVYAIIAAMQSLLPDAELRIYAGPTGFLPPWQVDAEQIFNIASANWLASASLAAQQLSMALFVDIGSTTSDLLLITDHQLINQGYSDYQRLISGELLYSGVVRTSVMAVAQNAHFNGHDMGLMLEHFATMADVYRLTGDLHPAHDQSATADGAAKSPSASARRLSRLTGYEFTDGDMTLWREFAGHLKDRHKQLLKQACLRQLGRSATAVPTLIGAGIGRFLLRELADELDLLYQDFSELLPKMMSPGELDSADCAPAVAVAWLARRHQAFRPS